MLRRCNDEQEILMFRAMLSLSFKFQYSFDGEDKEGDGEDKESDV